ncbi:MAG: cell envelope integrity protein TolA [Rickettsiaceae bacterium H1]|nr:cell envelope integrity protein TolA [Rickettsiaceae bacterium H1]
MLRNVKKNIFYYLRLLLSNPCCRQIKHYLVYKKPNLGLSLLLHFVVILLLIFNLSSVAVNKSSNDKTIVIDLVPIGEVTNVKIATDTGKKSYSQDKELKTPKEVKQKVQNKIGEKLPIMQSTKKVKKKPMESEVIKKQSKSSDKLPTALKAIKQEEKEMKINIGEKKKEGLIGKGKDRFDELQSQTINLIESIGSQFIHCWSVPHGALNSGDMMVKINVELDSSGKVLAAELTDFKRYNRDSFFRAVADSALRAVYMCSPLQGLSKEQYDLWKSIELVFDPQDMMK